MRSSLTLQKNHISHYKLDTLIKIESQADLYDDRQKQTNRFNPGLPHLKLSSF